MRPSSAVRTLGGQGTSSPPCAPSGMGSDFPRSWRHASMTAFAPSRSEGPSWAFSGSRASTSEAAPPTRSKRRSEEHTSELQSRGHLVCRLLLEKKQKYFEKLHDRSAYRSHSCTGYTMLRISRSNILFKR